MNPINKLQIIMIEAGLDKQNHIKCTSGVFGCVFQPILQALLTKQVMNMSTFQLFTLKVRLERSAFCTQTVRTDM